MTRPILLIHYTVSGYLNDGIIALCVESGDSIILSGYKCYRRVGVELFKISLASCGKMIQKLWRAAGVFASEGILLSTVVEAIGNSAYTGMRDVALHKTKGYS